MYVCTVLDLQQLSSQSAVPNPLSFPRRVYDRGNGRQPGTKKLSMENAEPKYLHHVMVGV